MSELQFGLNQVGFPDSVADGVAAAADAGYEGVELDLAPETLGDPDRLDEFGALASDTGLEVCGVLTAGLWETPLSSADRETRERGRARGRDLLAAADRLGADTALVVPGVVDEATPYDVAYEYALDSVRHLAREAADLGVTVGVENVWNDFLLSPLEFRRFVDEAAEAGPVGAYFDVGNVLRYGRPEQWIRLLGERIVAVHVKDFDESVGGHGGFTYPLQGDVDWDAVSEALDDVGFEGWVCPEVPPYETRPGRMPAQVLANVEAVL